MAVAKVLEISSDSKKSFEDAIASGIKRASETVSGIREAWVASQTVTAENGEIKRYRVGLKITFVLKD